MFVHKALAAVLSVACLSGLSSPSVSQPQAPPVTVAIALKAFDTFCVSTLLDEKRFRANIGLFKAVELLKEQVALMGENDFGFVVRVDDSTVVASMGTKRVDRVVSRSCVVSMPGLTMSETRQMLEKNFPVKLRDRIRQGLSEMLLYSANLAGYSKEMAISVQHSAEAAVTSVSLFEIK